MAEKNNIFFRSTLIIISFALFFVTWYFNLAVRPFESLIGDSKSIHYTLNYLLAGLIPAATMLLMHKTRTILRVIGLSHGFGTGLLFGVLCTLPMCIGYAFIGDAGMGIAPDQFFTFVFIAGFFEEVIFRGFVFGELFRTAHWGFLPAALLTALAFGVLHLYQGHDVLSALGSFAVTAFGSIFFSWLYVEWNNNLWCVIWLHILMNLPWVLFSVSSSGAVGGAWANVLRACTLVLAIGLTVVYKKRRGLPYFITFKTLIANEYA